LKEASMNKIALLNDLFRNTFLGGRIVITSAVNALPLDVKSGAFLKTQHFKDFTEDNDPHGEHDFGSFEIGGDKFFWKIDYYDPEMIQGSEDPADPAKTVRVLTIMLADEY
jgi:hypothetical protein